MAQSAITFIINGNTYHLRASDAQALRSMPAADRGQLIELLEAVREQEKRSQAAVQQATARAGLTGQPAGVGAPAAPPSIGPTPERLGSGDVDALMARLVLEEQRNKKPGLTRQHIYTWFAIVSAVIILLVLLF